jgi:hypothetical protein
MGVVMMLSSAVILFTPFVDNTWLLLALFTLSLTGMATAISLNFSLVNDLLRNPEDSGKAMAQSLGLDIAQLLSSAAPTWNRSRTTSVHNCITPVVRNSIPKVSVFARITTTS